MSEIAKLIDAEMKEYSEGAYADHGSARNQLERFAELVTASLKADAARYRWLIDSESLAWPSIDLSNACHRAAHHDKPQLIDEAIDAIRARSKT